MDIVERIFYLLEKQGKKQSEFARFLDVRDATISDWKRKRSLPSVNTIGSIADYLGVSTDYLIMGTDSAANNSAINQGIFGDKNQNNTVTIHGNGTIEISEFEGELVKVCGRLDMRRKNALLSYAYELEKQIIDNK